MRGHGEAKLRLALDRLGAAKPLHTDGKFTLTNLGVEAGMSRSQVYNYRDVVAAFRAMASGGGEFAAPTIETKLREALAQLTLVKSKHAAEIDDLKNMQSHLLDRLFIESQRAARATRDVNDLKVENARLVERNADLTRSLAESGNNIRTIK